MIPEYPLQSSAKFNVSCMWLTPKQLSSICMILDDLWNDAKNSSICFEWINWLSTSTLEYFNIKDILNLSTMQHNNTLSSNSKLIKLNI